MRLDFVGMETLASVMDWIFMTVPYYNIAHALFHTNKMNRLLMVSSSTLTTLRSHVTDLYSLP